MERVDLTILGATEAEIAPLALESTRTIRLADRSFSLITHRGLRLLIGTTGIGKVNAAATTAAVLSKIDSGEVLNVGCAGAFSPSGMAIGDVLVTDNCICGDEGILTKDGPAPLSGIGIPLLIKNGRAFCDSFPLDDYLRRGQIRAILPEGVHGAVSGGSPGFQVRYGPSLTVGMASGDAQTASARFRRFGALAENMEGSAIAQTCLLFDVPFLEIRGISNMAGERDKARWDLPAAVDHCLEAVKILLAGPRSR
ncbi:MAG: futalosine hydrolase [Syntrophobacteraceae bacterium]|nr:futalosine hydrolase [Syntrophobacteraceae bacterium]